MRLIIWDDETLQPITVVNLPIDDEAIERMGRRMRLAPPRPIVAYDPNAPLENERVELIEITFEKLCRQHRYNGLQECWMAFTTAVELAILLKPDWLLGQISAVEYLQDQNDRLTGMLMQQLSR